MCSSTQAPSLGTGEQRETSSKLSQAPVTRVARESSVSAIAVRREQVARKGAALVHGTGNGNVVVAAAGGLGVNVTGLTPQLGRWVSTSHFPDFALTFAASASRVGGFECVIPCRLLALFGPL